MSKKFKQRASGFLSRAVPDLIPQHNKRASSAYDNGSIANIGADRPGCSRDSTLNLSATDDGKENHVYMRRIKSEPLTFIGEVYGRSVDLILH